MKKAYTKPLIYVESFEMTEHISKGCDYHTNFGNQCPISEAGVVFFTSTGSGCNNDGISMFTFAGIDPENATVEDLIGMNIQCYNSLRDFSLLYTS